ncbi:hypothetical protein SR187_8115 [Streptococcus ruminantium]|uniref:Uncharacterized protein n=1 Tax=Streptococcus ruminantium TaxID=1917441 RepID=A0A2Z5TPU3_9STRE|nr:hypothetical protein SR187_8115 [Streptococcus ruminantium]
MRRNCQYVQIGVFENSTKKRMKFYAIFRKRAAFFVKFDDKEVKV